MIAHDNKSQIIREINLLNHIMVMKPFSKISIKMKIFVLCFLIPVIASGQSFNDTIITYNDDTIHCRIIDVRKRTLKYSVESDNNNRPQKIRKRLVKDFRIGEGKSIDLGIMAGVNYVPDEDSENWIVLHSGATTTKISKVFYASKDSKLIRKIELADHQSSSIVYPWEIETAFLNGTFYESVFFPYEYAGFFRKKTDTTRNSLTQFLGYYVIFDSVSLIRYGETTKQSKNIYGYEGTTLATSIAPPKTSHGKYLGNVSGHSIYEKHCIKKGYEVISIPPNYGGFYRTVKMQFGDHKELMQLIDKKRLLYKDLEEIVKRYNEGLKKTQSKND